MCINFSLAILLFIIYPNFRYFQFLVNKTLKYLVFDVGQVYNVYDKKFRRKNIFLFKFLSKTIFYKFFD